MNYVLISYGAMFLTLIITLGAQGYINSWYKKTKKIKNAKNLTGYEVARLILDKNNLQKINVDQSQGILSDHYDPTKKTVRLSPEIYHGASIASASVAAHECGHALQDKEGYFFLKFRSSIIPIVNFASYAGYLAILIGLFSSILDFIWIGILMEFIILFFQLITLPVEFNASSRALQQIEKLQILDAKEQEKSKKMLTSAALTYVASVATAIIEILRLVLLVVGRDDK